MATKFFRDLGKVVMIAVGFNWGAVFWYLGIVSVELFQSYDTLIARSHLSNRAPQQKRLLQTLYRALQGYEFNINEKSALSSNETN